MSTAMSTVMSTVMSTSTAPVTQNAATVAVIRTGPSFAAALIGFLSTTVATTILVVLIGTVA